MRMCVCVSLSLSSFGAGPSQLVMVNGTRVTHFVPLEEVVDNTVAVHQASAALDSEVGISNHCGDVAMSPRKRRAAAAAAAAAGNSCACFVFANANAHPVVVNARRF